MVRLGRKSGICDSDIPEIQPQIKILRLAHAARGLSAWQSTVYLSLMPMTVPQR